MRKPNLKFSYNETSKLSEGTMLEFEKVRKTQKDNRVKGSVIYYCIVKDCIYHTTSGTEMYDHLKIVHNFMLFEERSIES